ncbi:MAG: hypothetical protein IJ215_04865, partial [Clostridia bacterium]|nr:hypothetical protein [Clostridia bacterium]
KIQLVEATERIEENLLEGMHPVKKIKHIKMKRFLVRMRNLKNNTKDMLLAQVESFKQVEFITGNRLVSMAA